MAPALPPLSTRRSTKMELRHTPKVAPYVRRDRSKKKKKEGEGSKNGRTTTPSPSPLLSFLFVEIAEFKSDSRFKIFKY